MKTIRTPNHTKKGQCITVEPIRDSKALAAISRMLSSQPRNLLLFTMGINYGLRTSDLLKLKVKDVSGLSVGNYINIRESKKGKPNALAANQKVYDALSNFLSTCNLTGNDYLFKSRKGSGPLKIQTANGHIRHGQETLAYKAITVLTRYVRRGVTISARHTASSLK